MKRPDPKDVNPYDVKETRRLMKSKKRRPKPEDINPYETRKQQER